MELGGNIVKSGINFPKSGQLILGEDPYIYYCYVTKKEDEISLSLLNSFTVFVLKTKKDSIVYIRGKERCISKGDVIQVEAETLHLNIKNGPITLLISGTKEFHPVARGIQVTESKYIYKVNKPWGHELWLNEQHPCYALKEIFIKKGTKTSLQYHNFKRETNLLIDGTAKLHFKKDQNIKNENVSIKDISQSQLTNISTIDVVPKILHRLEAVTDILLYETSTPHLDDVIRVLDDTNRIDGRISKEHFKK